MYTAYWWIIVVVGVSAFIYGLHRLALALENRGLIDFLKQKPPLA